MSRVERRYPANQVAAKPISSAGKRAAWAVSVCTAMNDRVLVSAVNRRRSYP